MTHPAIFTPVERIDGYLPLKDHGLIGDGTTAALVGRDGGISWLCIPRFDDPPLFCGLLDARRGGSWTVAPDPVVASRQRYQPDTGVLVTDLRGPDGLVRVTDALALRAGADLGEPVSAARGELVRRAQVLDGSVDLQVRVMPRGGARVDRGPGGWWLRAFARPRMELRLAANRDLDGPSTQVRLETGQALELSLRWGDGTHPRRAVDGEQLLEETTRAWRRWAQCISYDGPRRGLVRRSAITLKLLDHFANGAIMAAPTSSLPEHVGGVRNWDYRYSWVRDAAFSVHALRRIGLAQEAWGFLAWVLDVAEHPGRPRVLYGLDGRQPPPEREDPELEGYRASAPVRWGNVAADQRQHDVYGEVLDCAYQWAGRGGHIPAELWYRLSELVEGARREWFQPDQGIWEVRSTGRPFTYSAALCHVAVHRGLALAKRFGFPCDAEGWHRAARRIRAAVVDGAWNEQAESFTEHLGGGGSLDASLLSLPLRRVVPADHPRMVATTEAIGRRLDAGGGLLYRYLPEEFPDGLPGKEGAFLLCSFWMVDNLAYQGRVDEAHELYERLCDRAEPLGLLPEQVDPGSGAFLGNYPQAFSHVGVVASGVVLNRLNRLGEVSKQ